MKNHNEAVKCPIRRILTAKGSKFLWKCIDIAAEVKGCHRYSKEFRETKEKLRSIIEHLLIDKGLTIEQTKELIKSRKYIN